MIQRVGVSDMVTISSRFYAPLPQPCETTIRTHTRTLGLLRQKRTVEVTFR